MKQKRSFFFLNFGLQNQRTRTLFQKQNSISKSQETLDGDRESFAEVITKEIAMMSDFY